MKRIFDMKKLAGFCAALALLSACSDDEFAEMQRTPDLDPSKTYITVPDFENENLTRTSFEIDESGAHFKWSDKDKVGIVPDEGDQARFEIVAEGAGSNTAAFDGGAWSLRPNHKYYAYYPFDKDNFANALATDPVTAIFTGQKQKKANQTDHLGAADYMAAAVTTPEEGALQFTFDHLCALVRIDVTAPVTATYTGVTLKAKTGSFVSSGQFVLTDENIAIAPTETSDQMTLELNDIEIKQGKNASLYMMVAPTDLSANESLAVELTNSDGMKFKTNVASKNFQAGKAYLLSATSFEADINSFSLEDCSAKKIDMKTGFITVQVPFGTDLTKMKASFTVKDGLTVKVGDEVQTSGENEHNFSKPVQYTIVDADGMENTYNVVICYSDMPVVYINTEGDANITDKKEYLNTEVYVTNSNFDCHYSVAKIKGRGNSSWGLEKKPYTLKLDKKAEFLGMDKHKTFAFVANHSDKTLLRNTFAYQMGREIYNNMSWNPHTRNVHLVLNGEYRGLYSVTETAKIDKNRVNIPNMEDCKSLADAPNYGFLLEVNARLDEYFNFKTTRNVCFSLKEPDGEDISEELRAYIQTKIQSVEDALYASDFKEESSANFYENHFDVNSFIDWYIVNEVTKNNDACFYSSCYMYYNPSDQKMHMGPLWDFDISCGNINYNGCDNYEGFWILGKGWYKQMFQDPAFVAKVKARWNEKKTDLTSFVANEITAQCSALSTDAGYNFQKWPIFGTYVWPNAAGYAERKNYQSEVDYLTTWLNNRITWLDTAINGL